VTEKLDIKTCKLEKPAPTKISDPCNQGNLVCQGFHPQHSCPEYPTRNFIFDVNNAGKVKDVQANYDAAGKKDIKKAKSFKSRNQDQMDQAMEKAKDEAFEDLLRWAKETGAKFNKKNMVGIPETPADSLARIDSSWPPFKSAVAASLGQYQDECKDQKWSRIQDVDPEQWEGAKTEEFYVCAQLDANGKVKQASHAYMRVHRDANGKIMAVETGTLDSDGKPLKTNIFKDGTMEPSIVIEEPKDGKYKWGLTHRGGRKYQVTVNPCPETEERIDNPYLKVVDKGDGTYQACNSGSEGARFNPWIENLTVNSDKTLQGTYNNASYVITPASGDRTPANGIPLCSMQEKPAGDKSEFRSVSMAPFGSAEAVTPAGNGQSGETHKTH
jgi:hypothetical protein